MPTFRLRRLRGEERGALFTKLSAIASAVLLALLASVLTLMGRVPWCACGIGLWSGDTASASNSQHLLDAYSFSHVLHGIIFYWVLSLVLKKYPLWMRLVFALSLEFFWEVLENTPMIIERYRDTAAENYLGDSVLNSTGDMLSVIVGFWLTARLHWKVILAVVVLIELIMLLLIRDNLTLNVIMLFYPFTAIREWQMAV